VNLFGTFSRTWSARPGTTTITGNAADNILLGLGGGRTRSAGLGGKRHAVSGGDGKQHPGRAAPGNDNLPVLVPDPPAPDLVTDTGTADQDAPRLLAAGGRGVRRTSARRADPRSTGCGSFTITTPGTIEGAIGTAFADTLIGTPANKRAGTRRAAATTCWSAGPGTTPSTAGGRQRHRSPRGDGDGLDYRGPRAAPDVLSDNRRVRLPSTFSGAHAGHHRRPVAGRGPAPDGRSVRRHRDPDRHLRGGGRVAVW